MGLRVQGWGYIGVMELNMETTIAGGGEMIFLANIQGPKNAYQHHVEVCLRYLILKL